MDIETLKQEYEKINELDSKLSTERTDNYRKREQVVKEANALLFEQNKHLLRLPKWKISFSDMVDHNLKFNLVSDFGNTDGPFNVFKSIQGDIYSFDVKIHNLIRFSVHPNQSTISLYDCENFEEVEHIIKTYGLNIKFRGLKSKLNKYLNAIEKLEKCF